MSRMPPADWKEWATRGSGWVDQDAVLAFEEFIERKWQDALNIAATEPNPRRTDGERGEKGTPVPEKTSWEGQGTLRLTGAVNVIEREAHLPPVGPLLREKVSSPKRGRVRWGPCDDPV